MVINWKKFIDALSLGFNDMEVATSLGINIDDVQRLKDYLQKLGKIGEEMDIETRRKIAKERLGLE